MAILYALTLALPSANASPIAIALAAAIALRKDHTMIDYKKCCLGSMRRYDSKLSKSVEIL